MGKIRINNSVIHLEALEASCMMCHVKQDFNIGKSQVLVQVLLEFLPYYNIDTIYKNKTKQNNQPIKQKTLPKTLFRFYSQ